MRRCRLCGLKPGAHAVFGRFDGPEWMLVGQAPGEREAALGRPFAGPAGRRLFEWLKRAGFEEEEFRSRCYVTAMMKCFPGKGGRGDLRPSRWQVENCAPFLEQEMEIVRPRVLIPVGGLAIGRFLGRRPLAETIGRRFLVEYAGRVITVVPLPHPSGASAWTNLAGNRRRLGRALRLLKRADGRG
ncbi:uracil-DNA glycosylase family protein [candidate division WOR-3 bacterium]|nr:uracil-DNA glycosylase family protein [candidate division WOR-3 bacterium]